MDQTKSMGKGMLVLAWIAGILLLSFFFGFWEEQQINPNQRPESKRAGGAVQVILEQNRYGHYVASGTINDKPVVFLLDTGATHVVIPEGTARRLGLKKGMEMMASTANGVITVYRTEIDTIAIGDIRFHHVNASINPGMESTDEILLGMSALGDIEFRQENGTLTLLQNH